MRLRNGRAGPLYLLWQVCGVVLLVSFVVSAAISSPVPAMVAGVVVVAVLVTSRWTGLFVTERRLRLRVCGVTRWSVPIDEVTAVTSAMAPPARVNPRGTDSWRIEIKCGAKAFPLPADVLSRLWTPDPKETALAVAAALTKELHVAGATSLVVGP